jgi:hypothetical protein
MPVIELPTDQRWGQLGAGLGQLISKVVEARQQNQATQGVAKIMQDPSIPDGQKPYHILQQYGERGWQVYGQITNNAVMQQKLGVGQSEILKNTEQARLAGAEAAQIQPKTRAQIDKDAADAQAARARSSLVPSEQAKNEQEANRAQAEANKAQLEADRLAAAGKGGGGNDAIEAALAPGKDLLPDADLQSARVQGQQAELAKPGTGAAATGRAIDEALKRNQASPDTQKLVGNTALAATSAQAFIKAFEKEPQTGLASGVTIKALLEKYGFGTGDPNVLGQVEADILQAGTMAQQGGGFFSVGRFRLASDMVPNLRVSPLSNVIRLDQIADRNIAELQSRQDTEPRSKLALQKQIDRWQQVKDWTNSYQSYPITNKATVLLHNGDELNAKTFAPQVVGSRTYFVQGGQTLSGAQIIQNAMNHKNPQTGEAAPIDPAAALAAYQRGQ